MARPKLIVYDVPQGGAEWFEARRGKATASEFSAILADGAGRLTLLRKLAGEIITGVPAESYSNPYMERGKRMEPEARGWYARKEFVQLERPGFIYNPEIAAGWSPDSLVGKDGAVEVKTVAPHLLIPILEKRSVPTEHMAQCMGGRLVGRRAWLDLVLYWPGMPKYIFRFERDRDYEAKLAAAISGFNADLRKLVRKIKSM